MEKRIFVEGHRGYCARYPENTMISFEAAIDLGVDGFEFDVWLSKDKVPVIMVDRSTYRTCGVEKNINELTLAEIRELNPCYSLKFGDKFAARGLKVPTLEEVCRLVAERTTSFVMGVEIKDYTEECVDITVEMLKKYGLFNRSRIYAFDSPTLKYAKEKYGIRTLGYCDFEMYRRLPDNYKYYDEIAISVEVADSEAYPIYASKGLPIHLWAADDEATVRMCLAKGADHITANDPVPLMSVLGRPIGKTKD